MLILTTINARYIHTAFGLRYLYANMGNLQADTLLLEFGLQQKPADIVEELLKHQPKIIGFGVYIWNVLEIGAVLAILKQVAPEVCLVLGGPEVSFPLDLPPAAADADYIIGGPGEISFPALCGQILAGQKPTEKFIHARTAPLAELCLPYAFYSDIDIRQRIVYVEASRGCPFKCEFCLSALDTTAKPFALTEFLSAMALLYQRGARHFKFIDRTFNLKIDTSIAILEFFLARLGDELYLHFEVIPDNLPERLKTVIAQFPPGVLQFEIGVQTFNVAVQHLINRKQDNQKTQLNLQWLRQNTHTHIHADLIAGLPGDSLADFSVSFDTLVRLNPQEIQLGILKRLRGAPINRLTEAYQMRYDPHPPYSILSTRDMDFNTLQRLQRFSRYWDLIGNSGRFAVSLPLILADSPFARFMQLSDSLYAILGSTWQIALKRLMENLYRAMTESLLIPQDTAMLVLSEDFLSSGEKGHLLLAGSDEEGSSRKVIANKRQRQRL